MESTDTKLAPETTGAAALAPSPAVVGRAPDGPAAGRAQPYDFRQPSFLAAGDLRKLKARHEEFARSLSARLSIFLRLEFTLHLSAIKTLSYCKFIESLATPTHLTLFKMDPLRGICVLEISPRLGLSVVDRLLGGPAQAAAQGGELTEIEITLLDQVVQIILSEWCNQWIGTQELRPILLGHENNGRFLQTSPQDNAMLVVALEARLGECSETLQIGFPYYAIEPLIRHLNTSLDLRAEEKATPAPPKVTWNRQFDDVPVELIAEWQGLQLSARDVAHLKLGDVLQLDPHTASQVHLRLGQAQKFRGRLGTRGNKWAVEVLKPETVNPANL